MIIIMTWKKLSSCSLRTLETQNGTKKSTDINHNVGASKEMACSCKFRLFRTWSAGHVTIHMQKQVNLEVG